jgi:metal-sulfur cluster biosynthetic enzyme
MIPTMPGAPSREQIMEELSRIEDPCSVRNRTPLSLVDMKLVEDVVVSEAGHVSITLLLTDPSCVFFFDIARSIKDALGRLPGVGDVTVETIGDRWWEPDRLTPEVRERLARMRAKRDRDLLRSRTRRRDSPATGAQHG